MSNRLVTRGHWPQPVTFLRGWSRAEARPWNEESGAAQLRLLRGTADFLTATTAELSRIAQDGVYSPALYSSAAKVWARAGYRRAHRLIVMERGHVGARRSDGVLIERHSAPDWPRLLEVDKSAFEGFWRMGELGLREALAATRRSTSLVFHDEGQIRGYALVGAQWGMAYLQRMAVDPVWSGRGIGKALMGAALGWAGEEGARSMVLNVRQESARALRLYERLGFSDTGTRLEIMSYQFADGGLLN